MVHSTRTLRLLCAALAGLVLLALATPAGVRADGDPASDVLASQALFLPQDAAVPAQSAARLAKILGEAAARGLDVRVAIVASRADLGSVTSLFGRPQLYARFLAAELSLVLGHPAIVVVMPQGIGVAGPLAKLPTSVAPGSDLGAAAAKTVLRLAAARGRPLADPRASAAATSSGGAVDIAAVATLLAGVMLVAAAWTASLRVRPLRAES